MPALQTGDMELGSEDRPPVILVLKFAAVGCAFQDRPDYRTRDTQEDMRSRRLQIWNGRGVETFLFQETKAVLMKCLGPDGFLMIHTYPPVQNGYECGERAANPD